MDNADDLENNAKISDSAYSNSCSNSQSRRSHSSKSTHSVSSASGSSGYGGKPSESSIKLEQIASENEAKKKKQPQAEEKAVEKPEVDESGAPGPNPLLDAPKEEMKDVSEATAMLALPEKAVEDMEVSGMHTTNNKHEILLETMQATATLSNEASCQVANVDSAGFSCVISMHDGVVMYTTPTLTSNLGFPKEMWIGRSFIDFVHPKDRNTFASQITNVLAVPKIVNGISERVVQPSGITNCTMACRIRRHRNLETSFGVKNQSVIFMPFLLKFFFKDINEGDGKIVYLIIQATPIYSSYKTPNESKVDATPFVIRHSAEGNIEYIDIESVPFLGYLPQDIFNTNALLLYHPDDLPYLKTIYESIVKEGNLSKPMPFRMLSQNGDYVTLETEWSSFINPWSMKLEFVIGKHRVIEGPTTPDVFQSPQPANPGKPTTEEQNKIQQAEGHRESILKILKDVLTKPAEKLKRQMSKRCHDLAMIVENILEKPNSEELMVDIQDQDLNCCERDSVMLGEISPHHDHNDSKSSTGTLLSYNQLNYNDNLQRFFDSHEIFNTSETVNTPNNTIAICNAPLKAADSNSVHTPTSPKVNDQSSLASSNAVICPSPSSATASAMDARMNRLTESLLSKHNHKMEKELVKCHRGSRTSIKVELPSDTRQKKKEHLARCNATYQPTLAGTVSEELQQIGVKRSAVNGDEGISNKQHCPSSREMSRPSDAAETGQDNLQTPASQMSANNATWQDPSHPVQPNAMNPFTPGIPPPMLMQQMPSMYPVYYAPNGSPVTHNVHTIDAQPSLSQQSKNCQSQAPQSLMQMQYSNPPMPWMYPQPMFGAPFVYPQMPYNNMQQPGQQVYLTPSMIYNQHLNTLGLPTSNYLQACNSSLLDISSSLVAPEQGANSKPAVKLRRKLIEKLRSRQKNFAHNRDSVKLPKEKQDVGKSQSTGATTDQSNVGSIKPAENTSQSEQISDETIDKTDGDESSYNSTFYSSFFKTESGSAEDSSDPKKNRMELSSKSTGPSSYTYEQESPKKAPLRKSVAPWMENVAATPELHYKYQIPAQPRADVLKADEQKLKKLEQPALVNDQLLQLYQDLQLQGMPTRLALEEGITSSSSGEEFIPTRKIKIYRRKREYSKLCMIYEVDAPLPPPEIKPSDSKSSPSDSKASPNDSEMSPTDSKISQNDPQASTSDSKASPHDAKASPNDAKASPNDAKASPSDSMSS